MFFCKLAQIFLEFLVSRFTSQNKQNKGKYFSRNFLKFSWNSTEPSMNSKNIFHETNVDDALARMFEIFHNP